MDLLSHYWSEVDRGVKIKYLTPIMFSHTKAQVVMTDIFKALQKLVSPLKLMLSLGMDGPNVNKSTLNKLNQFKKGERPSPVSQIPAKLLDSCLPQ